MQMIRENESFLRVLVWESGLMFVGGVKWRKSVIIMSMQYSHCQSVIIMN